MFVRPVLTPLWVWWVLMGGELEVAKHQESISSCFSLELKMPELR